MKKLAYSLLPLGITFGLCLNIAPASAGFIVREVIPDAALSIDGFGSVSNNGVIQANIPTGSTIKRAYLYAASVWSMSPVSEVTFNGTELLLDDAITLSPNNNPATTVVWDVTNIIASSFTGGIQDFSIVEAEDNDGAVLVVAYSNFSTEGLTSVILDGELSTLGDTVEFNFAPYTTGDFLVSLASSYSMQPSGQFTQIDVTTNSTKNRRLTTSAGGQDDGEDGNGALITVGGIGDNPANVDPNAQPDVTNPDDEYYNLALGNSANSAPFISQGDKYLSLTTQNQSNDDNVFGMFITSGFKITATPVPEPSMTLGIFGIGAIGALISRRGKKS
ncbi:PEP-CTERM sorting domain-containing protein [Microcystis aeruginosa KW]|uniref:PEP-CTERM sorting domain-containing protein n=1 Tax=Microcystis aeruginosa KW TaxID=1960155 RepID=A0A1V4BLK6_MICAE|nr:DUF3344 domain-containing protein [Microcystis aeruginosa]OPF14980.1 PEP-CTERM sorting domain-containing protein [Microcystis aeruginosa KW]